MKLTEEDKELYDYIISLDINYNLKNKLIKKIKKVIISYAQELLNERYKDILEEKSKIFMK